MVAIVKDKEKSKVTDEYGTPDWLFLLLEREFGFELDVCASADNYKVRHYYDINDDGLTSPWLLMNWCNPPYSKQLPWVNRAALEVACGNTTVTLQKYDPSTQHGIVTYREADEIRIIENRIPFVGADAACNFPCCISIFRPRLYTRKTDARIFHVNYNDIMS